MIPVRLHFCNTLENLSLLFYLGSSHVLARNGDVPGAIGGFYAGRE